MDITVGSIVNRPNWDLEASIILADLPDEFNTVQIRYLLSWTLDFAYWTRNIREAAMRVMWPTTRWGWKQEYCKARDKIESAIITAILFSDSCRDKYIEDILVRRQG